MKLTFYDGVKTVGGNKIVLEADGTNLLLDFGMNFSKMNLYFDEFMQPRLGKGVLDLLELDILPPLQGLFRPDLELEGIWERKKNHPFWREIVIDAILLSHSHLDHAGFLRFLRADVPVYSSLETALILKVTQDTGKDDGYYFFQERTINEEGHLKKESKKNGSKINWRKFRIFEEKDTQRKKEHHIANSQDSPQDSLNFLEFLEQAKTCIGKLTVKAWPVDHSVPGAFAYGIGTSSGWVIYTGDLRRHGKRGELTLKFAEEAQKLKPLALIIEGTRVSQFDEGSSYSEDTVKENVAKIISSASRLVIADFSPRNVERLISFFEVSRDLKRKLVITLKDLALLKTLSITDPSLPLPGREPSLLVLQDVKVSRKSWESDLLQEYRDFVITCQDIRRYQGDFVLCFSYYDLQELVDIEPQGGVYILSTCEPFNEEMAIDQKKLEAWVDHFGFEKRGALIGEKTLHASGHMDRKGLKDLIETINPRFVIPVHTENPGAFFEIVPRKKLILPQQGIPLEF